MMLVGLYDSDSQLYKLLPINKDVVGDIIWEKMLATKWVFYPADDQ